MREENDNMRLCGTDPFPMTLFRKGEPANQNNSGQGAEPVPPRFHNDERRCQFSFRIAAEDSFQFLVCCRQIFRSNSQIEHAFAQTLNEYQPAKILIP